MKRHITIFIVASCLSLSGCSADETVDENLKAYLLSNNDEYNDYVEESNNENTDNNGYYSDSNIAQSELENHSNEIHVSFASNSLLNVTYYKDSEYKEVIDKENCWLYPNDVIYAKIDFTSLVKSNKYEFQGFRMAVFDGKQANFDYSYSNGTEIKIPNDIQYKEISIIPEGAYEKRNLTFSAEYIDSDGNALSLSPIWEIVSGGQALSTKSENYSIQANEDFRVIAKYDPNEYYVERTEPEYESNSDDDGEVKFKQYNSQNSVDEYKIIFGKKFEIEINDITSTGPVKILIDGKEYKNKSKITAYAKLDTKVEITPKGNIKKIGSTKNLSRLTNDGYVYTVCDGSDTFEFDPTAYTYSNGTVVFYDSEHKEIKEKMDLCVGDTIYYIGKPDDGYTFSMGNDEHKINIDSNINYMLENELKFNQKQKIELPQPEEGGKIIYYLNGEEVKENMACFTAGTDELTASFQAENRYKPNNISDNAVCILNPTDHRIKFKDNDGNEISVDNVFEISSSQKAGLSVELDESVGTEIKFNIYNGTDEPINGQKSYIKKEMFHSVLNPAGVDDSELLEDEKIETVSGIKIAVSDWSPLKNQAIRLDVKKISNSDKETNEIYYILSGSGSQWISTDSGDSAFYKDIEVNISKVKGSYFKEKDYSCENAKVTVCYNDVSGKPQVKDGDFVDKSREVKMTVTADQNYRIYEKDSILFFETCDINEKYVTDCEYKELADEFFDMKSNIEIKKVKN